jgi:2-methylisocitrate lyase-like PEP mutase family enzyme
MNARRRLRELLASDTVVQMPSVFDGISARLAEVSGFPALSVTGNAVAGSLLGVPDIGLVSMRESADVARHLAGAVDIPVVYDADTGYGTALNVVRTIQEMELAGVAGIKLEDQVTPKRCGVLDVPIPVVTEREYLGKIEAAVHARKDPEFVIVARTDAKSTLGVEAAANRARRAIDAGADAAMVIGMRTPEEIEQTVSTVQAPLFLIIEEKGPLSEMKVSDFDSLGFQVAVYPGVVRYSMVGAALRALRSLKEDGSTTAVRADMATADEWNEIFRLNDYFELEQRYVRGNGQAATPAHQ